MGEEPQMFSYPLPSTPGGFSNVEDDNLVLGFAKDTLELVSDAFPGTAYPLAF